mgnify:FL=1
MRCSISGAKNIVLFGSGCGASALMNIVQNRREQATASPPRRSPNLFSAAGVKQRVKACISVLGLEAPPELEASSGVRPWYKEVRSCSLRSLRFLTLAAPQNSLVMLPSVHPLHDDARRAGKHQKKYGNIHRASACMSSLLLFARPDVGSTAAEDEGRPVHLLKASLPKIKDFIAQRIPVEPLIDGEEDIEMGNEA